MSSFLVKAVLAGTLAASAAVATPAELLTDTHFPDGYELVSDAPVDATFAEYAEIAADAVAHVAAGSEPTDESFAAFDSGSDGDGSFLIRELTIWPDADAAAAYATQAAVRATNLGLEPTDAPFASSSAFSGFTEDGWARMVTWSVGRYGATISQLTPDETSADVIGDAANRLALQLAAASAVGPDAPDATTGASPGASPDSAGGGISIGTILVVLVVAGVAIWLFVKVRRKMKGIATARRRSRSADEIIEEARAKTRAERPSAPPAEPDVDRPQDRSMDDVIAEARRRARDEVDRESDKWQPPDDY